MEHILITAKNSDSEKAQALQDITELFLDFEPTATDKVINQRVFGDSLGELDILKVDNDVAAFNITKLLSFEDGKIVTYLLGTITNPKFRNQGLFKKILQTTIRRHQPHYLALQTQVPIIYGGLCSLFGVDSVYPNMNCSTPPVVMRVAQLINQKQILDTTQPFAIVRDMYDIDRTKRSDRKYGDHRVNQFFAENLGTFDAFAVVVDLSNHGTKSVKIT